MHTSEYCILVILAFFVLVFHAIRTDEKRTSANTTKCPQPKAAAQA